MALPVTSSPDSLVTGAVIDATIQRPLDNPLPIELEHDR